MILAILELEPKINYILDLSLAIVLILAFVFIIGRRLKKMKLIISFSIILASLALSEFFGFPILSSIINIIVICVAICVILLNEGEFKKIFQNNKKSNFGAFKEEETADFQSLYKNIKELVILLSSSKTGAIITFEKHDSLQEYIDEGVKVHAPLSVPLLLTIFYEGTALHDGAVVIRRNMIEAASVFYLPTTRALNGKFGARHRASLGISEVSDSLTVVVSEETGRISFAYQGELISTNRDDFLETFIELIEK